MWLNNMYKYGRTISISVVENVEAGVVEVGDAASYLEEGEVPQLAVEHKHVLKKC